jgi:hypothetical protein
MMDLKEWVLAISGSGGIIGGLVAFAVFVYGRMDKKKEMETTDSHSYVDGQKNIVDALNQILESKNAEIARLESKLTEGEGKGILTLPKIQKISAEMRVMREALSKLNVLIMNDEETNIFAERFATVKQGILNIEHIIAE